jgi:putative membrane protein
VTIRGPPHAGLPEFVRLPSEQGSGPGIWAGEGRTFDWGGRAVRPLSRADRRGRIGATGSGGRGAVMMWWYGNGMGGWGYGLMVGANLLLWALLVAGVVALLRRSARSTSAEPRPTPEEMLAERFARGDIDEEEYRRRRDVLREWSRAGTER